MTPNLFPDRFSTEPVEVGGEICGQRVQQARSFAFQAPAVDTAARNFLCSSGSQAVTRERSPPGIETSALGLSENGSVQAGSRSDGAEILAGVASGYRGSASE